MSYSQEDIEQLCRLCANKAKDTGSINLFVKSNAFLIQQIRELTGLTLRDMPRQLLPRYICLKCNQDLSHAYKFSRQIISTQNYFRSKEFKIKLETKNEDEDGPKPTFDFVPLNECDIEEVPEKILISENLVEARNDLLAFKCVEAILKKEISPVDEDASTSKRKNNNNRKSRKKSPDIISAKRNIRNYSLFNEKTADDNSDATNDIVSKTSSTTASDNDDDPDFKINAEDSDEGLKGINFAVESEVSDEGFKSPDIFMSVKKKRQKKLTHSKEEEPDFLKNRTFVCHICQTSLENLSCLKLHFQKQHKGEKFKCELCDKKFFTTKTLVRHFCLHQGVKPFKCHYCDMSFNYGSTRCRHETRSHSKDVPFLCYICGKTFNTTYSGKDHMTVHTKERAFHCSVCKADFLRRTHLTTHYRSMTHKNNVQKFNKELLPVDVNRSQQY